MIDIKRRTPRYDVKFNVSYGSSITGTGVNISQGGFGILTENKLEFDKPVAFETEIKGFIFSDKIYKLKGRAELLYSSPTRTHRDLYYNGFKFSELYDASRENLYSLINDIRQFSRSPDNLINKSLADFFYYPSDDLFYKAKIFKI